MFQQGSSRELNEHSHIVLEFERIQRFSIPAAANVPQFLEQSIPWNCRQEANITQYIKISAPQPPDFRNFVQILDGKCPRKGCKRFSVKDVELWASTFVHLRPTPLQPCLCKREPRIFWEGGSQRRRPLYRHRRDADGRAISFQQNGGRERWRCVK